MCLFSMASAKVKTHIHLSTTFTGAIPSFLLLLNVSRLTQSLRAGWYLPSGSIVHEELIPPTDPDAEVGEHANTCEPFAGKRTENGHATDDRA